MGTQKNMAAKPKCKSARREVESAEVDLHRDRRVEKGQNLCRRVGGDRGQSKNNATGKG